MPATDTLTTGAAGPAAPQKVLEQIAKLLNLANRNTNEHEAAQAAAKAQALCDEWNLSVAAVEDAADTGKRQDEKVKGGFYRWQRDLWKQVAELHFCLYFITETWDANQRTHKRRWDPIKNKEVMVRGAYVTRHRVVGRVVNAQIAIRVASYLERAIEDAVNERTRGARSQAFSNWAISFRTGAAHRLMEKLEARRRERVAEAAERARTAAEAAGFSTSTALTIKDVEEREHDANMDFLHGEGWSARRALARAEAAEAYRRQQAERTAWAAAHPEEAAAEEAKRQAEYEAWYKKNRYRGPGSRGGAGPRDNLDYGAYRAGSGAAESIGLDEPVAAARPAGLLR